MVGADGLEGTQTMDSQQPPTTPEPHEPQAQAQATPTHAVWPPDAPTPPAVPPAFGGTVQAAPRRMIRSTTALGLALALGLGSFGAGYALVHHGGSAQTATSATPTAPSNGQGPLGEGGFTPPGFGQSDGLGGSSSGQSNGQSDTSEASTSAEKGMVEITSKLENGAAAGTGMILTSGGIVVTNHHVVAGATQIQVTVVSTGQTYTARYLGSDSTKDVALLQLVGASNLQTVDVDTSGVNAGDQVTAVGDAGGDGGSLTASPGTVTALQQSITAQSEGGGSAQRLTGLIQVDADLMPGDSGGALLNSDGNVVGMNVAASSDSTTGFAIPMATVMSVVHAIENGDSSGTVDIGYDAFLGVALANGSGTTISGVVDGGGAAAAGLRAGDRITAVDGTRVSTASGLRSAIASHRPGDQVRVTWTSSGGQSHTATVTLGQAPIA
jgi:S1-C subfamily serine protease